MVKLLSLNKQYLHSSHQIYVKKYYFCNDFNFYDERLYEFLWVISLT